MEDGKDKMKGVFTDTLLQNANVIKSNNSTTSIPNISQQGPIIRKRKEMRSDSSINSSKLKPVTPTPYNNEKDEVEDAAPQVKMSVVDLEDALGICKEDVTESVKEFCKLRKPEAHKAEESIVIKNGDVRELHHYISTWSGRLMWDGVLQFTIENFRPLSRGFWDTFVISVNKDGKGFQMNYKDKENVRISVLHIWRISSHLFYTATSEGQAALKVLPCLESKSMGEITSILLRYFGGEATMEENAEKFWHKLYQMEIDAERKGYGMMLPHIRISKYYDIENSCQRAGFNMNTIPNPLRTEMRKTVYGYPSDTTGITNSRTDIGFPGSFSCSKINDACYNFGNFNTGGDMKVWQVVSGMSYPRLVRNLQEELGRIKVSNKDVLRVYNTDCQFHHHRILIAPRQLELWDIDFKTVYQPAGDLLILGSMAMHMEYSLSLNVAYSVNMICGDYHLMAGRGIKQCDHPSHIPSVGEMEPEMAFQSIVCTSDNSSIRYKASPEMIGRFLKHSANLHHRGLKTSIKRSVAEMKIEMKTHRNPITETDKPVDEKFHNQLALRSSSPILDDDELQCSEVDDDENVCNMLRNIRTNVNERYEPKIFTDDNTHHNVETQQQGDPKKKDDTAHTSPGEKSISSTPPPIIHSRTSTVNKSPSTASTSRPMTMKKTLSQLASTSLPFMETTKHEYDLKYWMKIARPLTLRERSRPEHIDAEVCRNMNAQCPLDEQMKLGQSPQRFKCPVCPSLFASVKACQDHINKDNEHTLYGPCQRPGCKFFNNERNMVTHMMSHWVQEQELNQFYVENTRSFRTAVKSDPSINDLEKILLTRQETIHKNEMLRKSKGGEKKKEIKSPEEAYSPKEENIKITRSRQQRKQKIQSPSSSAVVDGDLSAIKKPRNGA